MPRFKFKFLPGIPLPSPAAIRDAIGERMMYWTPEPLQPSYDEDGYSRLDLRPADHHTATMVTSRLDWSGRHKPVIDIDLPCMLVPSTQPGHFHLYIDKEMTWDNFVAILEALERAGVVGKGFVTHTKRRGYATVRYPGVTKDNEAARIADTKLDLGIDDKEDDPF
jgi:hypothetical protein